MAWHDQKPWHLPAVSAVCGATDDYVEGLAKRGIVRLPGDEMDEPSAAIAVAEMRARNTC
jgi:hypothetical protein